MSNIDPTIVIRAARGSDGALLERLAELDSQRPLSGEVLVGERGGELVAAFAPGYGRAIADPFQSTRTSSRCSRSTAGAPRRPPPPAPRPGAPPRGVAARPPRRSSVVPHAAAVAAPGPARPPPWAARCRCRHAR
jgi:hypothetical protein